MGKQREGEGGEGENGSSMQAVGYSPFSQQGAIGYSHSLPKIPARKTETKTTRDSNLPDQDL